MTDRDLIDKAMREHCRLQREINEKDVLIAKLKKPAQLVREALDRFCPSHLKGPAEKWLATMELQ